MVGLLHRLSHIGTELSFIGLLLVGAAVVIAPGLAVTLQEGFSKPVAPGERTREADHA